jgi:hypothetical protein
MRAIALAVLFGTWGIEQAIRGKTDIGNYPGFMSFLGCVFFICLIFGW